MAAQSLPDRQDMGTGLWLLSQHPSMCSTVDVEKNESIYNSGDSSRCMYVVESGRVKTVMVSRGGKECLLDIYAPGEVLGELSLLGVSRAESAVAMRPTVLTRIPADAFLDALDEEGLIGEFLRCLVKRVGERQETITQLVTANSELRLGMTLLRLGRKLGRREQPRMHLEERITHEELSEMIGTTRTRVGHFLKHFRSMGLIEDTRDSFLSINESRMIAYLDASM